MNKALLITVSSLLISSCSTPNKSVDSKEVQPTETITASERNSIAAEIQKIKPDAEQCYLKTIKKDPSVAGMIRIGFDHNKDQKTTHSKIIKNTTKSEDLANCVLKAAKTIDFSHIKFRPILNSIFVSYPFYFKNLKPQK